MAKRSPILGYNHNVRYRGLVFHVQTEDSGVLSPHLFTHLFYEGVIVSTRKLVYDAGASEDAIKALMQAQHKAVLKDLKLQKFDDKIDQYLGSAPGLEPRGTKASDRAATEPGEAPTEPIALDRRKPIGQAAGTPPPALGKPRTQTVDRTSRSSQFRSITPPHAGGSTTSITLDSSPEIEIIENEDHGREREPRDTAVDHLIDDGVPSPIAPDATVPSDRMPRADPRPGTASRPPSQTAAALPAVRPLSRPAVTPPSVVSRPVQDHARGREDSQAVEIYSPSPPSVDPPPGEGRGGERPGQYSMNRRKDLVSSEQVPIRDRTGRTAVPAGLARPRPPNPGPPGRSATASTPPTISAVPAVPPMPAAARAGSPPPSDGVPQLAPDVRPPSPGSARPPHLTAPIASRTATGSGGAVPNNVVMTRPAVIVGAPPRPVTGQTPRVRKAREDEGRGFGQGLISEKSLDEVILAYLSEDADEK